MLNKIKCKVCGTRFAPIKEKKYLTSEKITVIASISTAPTTFECFDCPQCGCQNAVGVRQPEIKKTVTKADEEEI